MSQYPPQALPRSMTPTNNLGIVGFVLSVLGLVGTCGLLSPVGAIVSLVAVFREPKGFAIAGLVLGILGSLWVLVAFVILGVGFVLIAAVLGTFGMEGISARIEMAIIDERIGAYVAERGTLPPTLADAGELDADALTDPWGQAYRFEPSDTVPNSYRLASDGADGLPGTEDDITVFGAVSSPAGAPAPADTGPEREDPSSPAPSPPPARSPE